MDKLKEFIRGEINYIDPSIVETLKNYDSIRVDSIVYDTKEIIDKIQRQRCPHCKASKAEVESLRYQLKQLNAPRVPPIKVLLRKYIDNNYVKIKERVYSRKQLFNEVNAYLREFSLQILENTDQVWKYVIETIVGDSNKNYRKLKIRKL